MFKSPILLIGKPEWVSSFGDVTKAQHRHGLMHQRPFERRTSGVLLHPTSLPGPYGIGDLGPEAQCWIAALSRAGQSWWQILPVGPTGYADSPYQSFSSFAGNTNLLSPDRLVEEGLLRPTDIDELRLGDADVIYANVIPAKRQLA